MLPSLLPASPSLTSRVRMWWWRIQMRYMKPNPAAHSFPASDGTCSISGLLNQCMDVTGCRYAIAKEVAAGSVYFAHTNTLNGAQWVKAFTDALQSDHPEWWEARTKTMRKENLVLLTNGAGTVLVLPKEMVQEFLH